MKQRNNRDYRFFVEDLQVGRFPLPPGEAHHAMKVLRLAVGAELHLFDGRGAMASGRIVEITKRSPVIEVKTLERAASRPTPVVHLGFAVPKGKRLDWLLEKVSELGAGSLRPVVFERSVAGGDELNPHQRDRWRSHCVSAAKQSGLLFLPDIRGPLPLKEFAGQMKDEKHAACLFGDTAVGATSLIEALRPGAGATPAEIHILVGPEGGLTAAERELLIESGFRGVRIGRTTLRVETAAIALLAGVMTLCETGEDAGLI